MENGPNMLTRSGGDARPSAARGKPMDNYGEHHAVVLLYRVKSHWSGERYARDGDSEPLVLQPQPEILSGVGT
jgi:hypothetical protein